MGREPTLQQLAPAAASGLVRAFGVWIAVVTTAAAITDTSARGDEVASWWFEVGALLLVASTGVVFAMQSSPFRAPFRRGDHILVLSMAFAATVLDETAQGGRNLMIHDDWGPMLLLPLYLLAFATLRPALELLIAGLAVTLGIGVLAAVFSPLIEAPVTPATRAVVAMSSVLPAAIGAAAFARVAAHRIRVTAALGPVADSTDSRSARLTEQQENVARLEAEVVPLLRRILEGGRMSAADGERARKLATHLRAALVAGLGRTWLDEAGCAVHDLHGYAERMSLEQRTAVRALLGSLPLAAVAPAASATIVGQDSSAVLTLTVHLRSRASRADLAPAIQLLRTVFSQVTHRITDHTVEVTAEFSATSADGLRLP